jgi:sterol desaturase/sphingolipid hydroxylase (fatty acid hydroxylase superfamily)
MLLEVYVAIVVGLNAWEYAYSPWDYRRVLVKNRALLPRTLFHMLVTNVVGTYCSDLYVLPNLHVSDSMPLEFVKFFVALHIMEAWTFFTHYGLHLFWYSPHKMHHQVIETSVLFTYHNGILDTLVAALPFYAFPYLLNMSRVGFVTIIGYNILMGSFAHRMPSTYQQIHYSFHNYHHAAFMYNFGTGYPGTFHVWDKIFGTLKSF